ncbi:thymidylate synthase [uncultured Thiomicrorhabdus sp.]
MYQRSADLFLGVPFNIASYATLTHMVAKLTGLKARKFVWTAGDLHLYDSHIEQSLEWLKRKSYDRIDDGRTELVISGNQKTIDDFKMEDFKVKNYKPLGFIKAPVAV